MKKLLFILMMSLFMTSFVSGSLLDNLISYYDFEQTSSLTDTYQGLHNGTKTNIGTGSITTGVDGIIGNAWKLNAVDGSNGATVNFSNDWGGVQIDGNFTFSSWVNIILGGQGIGTTGTIISEGDENANIDVCRDYVGTTGVTSTAGCSSITNGTDVDNSEWQFVVVTGDTNFVRLYVNGTEVSKEAFTSVNAGTLNDSSIGASFDAGISSFLNGELDEIGIWNRTLDSSEVSQLWGGGGGFSPLHISAVLNAPEDGSIGITKAFNSTISPEPTGNITNATLYIWDSDNNIFLKNFTSSPSSDKQEFIINSNITLGTYTWNVYGCGDDDITGISTCAFSPSNFTYTYSYLLNNHTYNNPASELSSQTFTLNLVLPKGLVVSTGQFYYNNTSQSVSKSTAGANTIYASTITTPSVTSDTNISWSWNVTLNDGTGNKVFEVNNGLQQVNVIDLDDCTTQPRILVNYTILDEDTQVKLSAVPENTSSQVELTLTSLSDSSLTTTFSQNYSQINSFAVCSSADAFENSNFRLDVLTSYGATDYVTEFYNIQNFSITNSTPTQNINLYDLVTTKAQEFLITYKDSNFLPVEGAIIDIQRKYISDGVSKSVEIPKTDGDGQALASLVLSDVIYSFTVSKNGEILGTFADRTVFCNNVATGDCSINLNVFASDILPYNFDEVHGLNYTLTFNKTSRQVNSLFSTTDGSVVVIGLNITKFDNFGNNTACESTLSTSSGSISCTVPDTFGNASIIASLSVDGDKIAEALFSLQDSSASVFAGTRIIMILILVVTLPLLALTSGVMTVVFLILGVVIGMMLNIIDGGSFVGVGSTLLWLIIAGGIIIWKISRRK